MRNMEEVSQRGERADLGDMKIIKSRVAKLAIFSGRYFIYGYLIRKATLNYNKLMWF